MSDKTILLTSVFKPCAVDDVYGRKENKPELFHNQITLYQGIFSQRDRNQSHQLHLIANNLEHPVTVLDWPTLKRYEKELRKGYDYVGISFIQPNFLKAKKMVDLTREVAPRTKIIIGGYGTMIDDIENIMDVDFVCRGEGISFMKKILGESEEYEFHHPVLPTVEFMGVMGFPMRTAAALVRWITGKYINVGGTIINGLGCAEGCDFCATGQFFRPPRITYLQSGQKIFDIMREYDRRFGITHFFLVGDENFFSDKKRVEELHRCMKEQSDKYYGIHLSFSSMNYLNMYDPRFLAELGLEVVWIGIESIIKQYRKNVGVDIPSVIGELHRYGIKTIISSILCLDEHSKENIWRDIDYHLSLKPVYSQFAHYSPSQGTRLWQRLVREDRILHSIPLEDRHAFKQIWFKHPHFTPHESEIIQRQAYEKDFREFGPSFARWIEVNYRAYPILAKSGNDLLHRRAEMIKSKMGYYKALLEATEHLVPTEQMRRKVRGLRQEIEKDFGRTGLIGHLMAAGAYLFGKGWEIRTKRWGDAIQPRTVVTNYKQKRCEGTNLS